MCLAIDFDHQIDGGRLQVVKLIKNKIDRLGRRDTGLAFGLDHSSKKKCVCNNCKHPVGRSGFGEKRKICKNIWIAKNQRLRKLYNRTAPIKKKMVLKSKAY